MSRDSDIRDPFGLDAADRTGRREKNREGGTDRGAALSGARLSVRSMLSHPTETTVHIVVQSTTTRSVWKVGLRIDLLRVEGLWTEYKDRVGRASVGFGADGPALGHT